MGLCRFVTLSVLLLLAACPAPTSFVAHFTVLARQPDISCVSGRLREIAKRNRIQSISDDTPGGVNHRFNFETASAPHSIGIYFADDGSFTFRNTAWAPKLTFRELQAARQSLFEVDELLDGRCDLGRIVDNVEESCVGEHCERLAAASAG